MSQRYEFVVLAGAAGTNFRELCRRFGISRKTGYKWLQRYRREGAAGLLDQSRRPRRSPKVCPDVIVAKVIALRQRCPGWSGYKLRRRLCDLGERAVPAASMCTEIVRRAGLISEAASAAAIPMQRFERAVPNELWQMDFKGDFPTQSGVRCHPLTMLDDHSRFNLILAAATNQTGLTVQTLLAGAFAQYGLPEAILCDNGAPWGTAGAGTGHTALTVWLLQLGVRVLHGRPHHPQTQGKEERFHRTLKMSCSAVTPGAISTIVARLSLGIATSTTRNDLTARWRAIPRCRATAQARGLFRPPCPGLNIPPPAKCA